MAAVLEERKIAADEAARLLGISKRAVYDLAAPHGPIPCFRYGAKCVRFNLTDILEYDKSCQHTLIVQKIVGVMSSTRLSVETESALLSSFRKDGIEPKPKTSQQKRTLASSRLRVVKGKSG